MDLHMHPPVSDLGAALALSLGVALSVADSVPDGVESEEDILGQLKTIRGQNWQSRRTSSMLRHKLRRLRSAVNTHQKKGFSKTLTVHFGSEGRSSFLACVSRTMSATKPPAKEISPKLRKTIDRLQKRIKESADYEVHQELKAVASRFPFLPPRKH